MSEAHDKIIADKEFRISHLDKEIKAKKESLEHLSNLLEEVKKSHQVAASSITCGIDIMTISKDFYAHIESCVDGINVIGNKLLTTIRDTKSALIFETNKLKNAADDAKQFRQSASDLKASVEIINSIRPTIRELMQNPEELNVIRNIIHACSPAIHRERPNTETSESSGTTPDVQVG